MQSREVFLTIVYCDVASISHIWVVPVTRIYQFVTPVIVYETKITESTLTFGIVGEGTVSR